MTVETGHSFAGLPFLWTLLNIHEVLFQKMLMGQFPISGLYFLKLIFDYYIRALVYLGLSNSLAQILKESEEWEGNKNTNNNIS